jgi:hypothetical protein
MIGSSPQEHVGLEGRKAEQFGSSAEKNGNNVLDSKKEAVDASYSAGKGSTVKYKNTRATFNNVFYYI